MKHLCDIKQLDDQQLHKLFELADTIAKTPVSETKTWHHGQTAMGLFFENSTRTLMSFQLAAQRLGMDFSALNVAHSSTQKGETLKDTLLTLEAMGVDAFIVRHQENKIQEQMADWLTTGASIINAGDGTHQHPTQGLLDLYTIRSHKPDLAHIKVSIIGDIKHSRVAGSLIDGLATLGNQNTWIHAPGPCLPDHSRAHVADSMEQALSDADVVVMLRIQKERIQHLDQDLLDHWHDRFGLNSKNLKWAKADAIVMHPGPMNRGIEIESAVADGSQSAVLEQVKNGVLLRQALLHYLLQKRQ